MQTMKNSVNAVDNAMNKTRGAAANVVYGTKANHTGSKISNLYGPGYGVEDEDERDLLFKCQGSGHWKVFIRKRGSKQSTKCDYTYSGAKWQATDHRDIKEYPEIPIKTRTYGDILQFVAGYTAEDKNGDLVSNCRSFCIRLAEYCSIPVHEVNKSFYNPIISRLAPSSQLYATGSAIKGTLNGSKQMVFGGSVSNVYGGAKQIGGSVVKNSAKIGLSTANQVFDTTSAVVQSPFKLFKR